MENRTDIFFLGHVVSLSSITITKNNAAQIPDVIDNRVLEPRNPEVQTLRVDVLLNTTNAAEYDGALTTIHCRAEESGLVVRWGR